MEFRIFVLDWLRCQYADSVGWRPFTIYITTGHNMNHIMLIMVLGLSSLS